MIQTALRVLAVICVFCGAFAARAEAPMIHGFMDSSEEWDDDGTEAYAHYGFYAFRADGSTGGFTPISPVGPDNSWATEGAIYVEGKYYCYAVTGTWSLYHLTFRVIDAESWKTTFSKSYTYKNSDKYSEESQRAYLVPADLTYDAIGDEFYAAARRGFGESDSYLCRVDRNTGELTRLVEIPLMVSLTADSHGTLYGLGMDGTLYTIDPAKGATEVAHTGLWPFRNRPFAATTDFSDDKIYWSFYGFTSENDWRYNVNAIKGVVTVDPATAATEMIWAYPRNEVFTSVNVLNAHPLAPAATGDLRFESDAFASPDGTVTCTVPKTTVNGTPMSGSVTVRTYVDTKLISTVTAAPGAVTSAKVSGMTDGEHTAAVEMQYGEHTSIRSYVSAYFGFDAPAAVSNLKLSADNSGTVATLTWDAPATTIHGNPVPAADIRYKVVRYPGEVIVKRSLSATSMTETITDDFASVRYVVTPYHVSDPAQPGPGAVSNSVTLGKDLKLPYSETFDTPSSWNRFTAIDANGDAYDEWKAQWTYDDAYCCAFYYGPDEHPADDWLVCPPMQFDPNKLYRLTFNWYAYYGYGSEFEIAIGSEATAENLSLGVIEKISAVSSFSDMPGRKVSIDFAVAPGDRFVAFHNVTVNMEHLSIDNITIEECGDSRVPARVGNPVGKRLSKSSIGISFEMPSYTAAGLRITAPMTARIYRAIDFKLLAEFTDVKPGAALEWTDNSPVEGVNTYIVVAVNEIGEGLDTEITVDMSDAIPVPLTNVVATYVSGSQIDLTWDPYTSTVGANGNPTDPAEVRYMVYKPVTTVNDDGDYVTSYNMIARDLSEPRFTDYAPLEGLDASIQQMLTYYVCAVNGAGEGEATESTGVIVGPAFTLPFAETWHNQTVATNPWFKGNDNGANWYVKHQGYEPMAPGQDGYGLITCEVSTFGGVQSEGSAAMFTPRIDLTSMTAPKLSFWMWTSPDYDSDIYLQVGMDVEGKGNGIYATKYYARADKAEWRHITVDLAAVADASRASVMLFGFVRTDNSIHVDNFSINGSAAPAAMRLDWLTGPTSGFEGDAMHFSASVTNLSAAEAKGASVSIISDAKILATAAVPAIAAGETATVDLAFTPAAANVGTMTISARLTPAAGLSATTLAAPLTVTIAANEIPAIGNLSAVELGDEVFLTWGTPAVISTPRDVTDSFELYESFAIDGIGNWTLTDGDGLTPFRFSNGQGGYIEWPNCQSPQAFIVFDNAELQSPFAPNSGDRMMVALSSPYGRSNDWLISPRLSGERQLVSFMASAMGSEEELFNIMISSTTADTKEFLPINGTEPISVGQGWRLFHFNCPEGTRHFAINYVSPRHTGLMIDDVHFHAAYRPMNAVAYNLYRDGKRLNSEPLTERTYVDELTDPKATYTVRPIFELYGEGPESNVAAITKSALDAIAATSAISIRAIAGAITVSGAEEGAIARVYTPAGQLVASSTDSVIPVAPGLYIVRIGSATAKVAVN